MMKKCMLLLCSVMLLHGCGGDTADYSYPDLTANELSYSYPYSGQQQVAPGAPFVARFSDPVKAFDASDMAAVDVAQALSDLRTQIASQVVWERTSDNQPVTFTVQLVDNDSSANGYDIDAFVLTPTSAMDPGTQYSVDMSGLMTDKGAASVKGGPIVFVTRGEEAAGKDLANTQTDFVVTRMLPDGNTLPFVDFTTFRLEFSHPLDANTVQYGSSISLRDGSDQLVPAIVLTDGSKLTIDPRDDLDPAQTYTLDIAASALRDRQGQALAQQSWSFQPRDTRPRALMAQRADVSHADAASRCDKSAEGEILSPLTGDAINCVPVKAVLLGNDTSSQTQSDVFPELGYVPNFPDTTPLRIDRGTLLSGSSVSVLVAGHVPILVDANKDGVVETPLQTGNISVTFISDASGYLIANPYTNKDDEPRHVRLWLDVAMTAQTPEANGALSQNLLHVEVVGTAIVRDGKLVMDGVGVVEPKVLGLEKAFGVLSFHLESYQDNDLAPPPVADTTLPTLQSWVPGDNPDFHRPGDPIILNFSEPLDTASIAESGALTLLRNGASVPFDWHLDGSALVINPQSPFDFSSASTTVTYEVKANSQITDLAGNGLDQDYDLSFAMPLYVGSGDRAPIATTVFPGYPCAIASGTADLGNDIQGRCQGGKNTDDLLPVMTLAADRPITAQFSQNMQASSFVLGTSCGTGTFRVEQVDNSGNCTAVVPGQLTLTARSLEFMPDAPWQDGQLYHFVLTSVDSGFSPSDCGVSAVCSDYQYPLQTVLLEGRPADQGGPDMDIHFRGAPTTSHVFQALRNLPAYDTNANYAMEAGEPGPVEDPANAGQYLTPPNSTLLGLKATGGLLQEANLGCGFDGRSPGDTWSVLRANPAPLVCNDKKYVYLTGALNADVVGWDDTAGAIKVQIYPTTVMTSSLDSYAVLNLILFKELDLIPTGPQIMRVRYQDDGSGTRNQPVTGYIRDTPDGPVLDITLDVYLDAPELKPKALGLTMSHSLHSYPLSLQLSGPVTLLPDGRMRIDQVNVVASDDINVSIGLSLGGTLLGAASMTLAIPQDGVNLVYISKPLKQ